MYRESTIGAGNVVDFSATMLIDWETDFVGWQQIITSSESGNLYDAWGWIIKDFDSWRFEWWPDGSSSSIKVDFQVDGLSEGWQWVRLDVIWGDGTDVQITPYSSTSVHLNDWDAAWSQIADTQSGVGALPGDMGDVRRYYIGDRYKAAEYVMRAARCWRFGNMGDDEHCMVDLTGNDAETDTTGTSAITGQEWTLEGGADIPAMSS